MELRRSELWISAWSLTSTIVLLAFIFILGKSASPESAPVETFPSKVVHKDSDWTLVKIE